jgi:hypothetical protein
MEEQKALITLPPRGTNIISVETDAQGTLEIKSVYSIDDYTCCLCKYRIVGHILTCENSHSLCSDCITGMDKAGDNKCPHCRSTNREWNILLELGLKSMIKPCPNTNIGCTHRSYVEDMEEHTIMCQYAAIKCPWCAKDTTSFDLQAHTEFECKYDFSAISCSNNIDFIKSDSLNNIFLMLPTNSGVLMYVNKTDTMVNLLCVRGPNNDDNTSSIMMTYYIDIESPERMNMQRVHTVTLLIHKSEQLIAGDVQIHSSPIEDFRERKNIVITGFDDKYIKGGRWMVQMINDEWHRATIIKRTYKPDRVLVEYDGDDDVNDGYDDWIDISDEHNSRIRPLDANGGRNTIEEEIYIYNMDEDAHVLYVMERSMGEL